MSVLVSAMAAAVSPEPTAPAINAPPIITSGTAMKLHRSSPAARRTCRAGAIAMSKSASPPPKQDEL